MRPVDLQLGLRRMRPRDPGEPHRVASTLELFFALTFAVAVAEVADALLSAERGRLGVPGLLVFAALFFGVWWAWVNFTWFASAFDTDDWLYRVTTVVQMGGVLVLAAGVAPAAERDDYRTVVVGYVVMRLAMVAQWLRASRNRGYRRAALRYAGGIAIVQGLWAARLLLPEAAQGAAFLVLVVLEFLVPVLGERARTTPFHLHHVGERYGLFTLIVLGEDLLAVTGTLIAAGREREHAGDLVVLGVTALVLIAGMWWVYFSREGHVGMTSMRSTFVFGYVHYLVFAGAAALAAGLELAAQPGADAVSPVLVRAATTVPVGVFLMATGLTVLRPTTGGRVRVLVPAASVVVAPCALLPAGPQVAALIVAALVVALEVDARRRPA